MHNQTIINMNAEYNIFYWVLPGEWNFLLLLQGWGIQAHEIAC